MSHHDYGIDNETFCGGHPDDEPQETLCKVCGNVMDRVQCWHCQGEGGFHDCGEDCCPCLNKEEITVDCEECNGEGYYWECISVPHTEQQMEAYRAIQDEAPDGGKAG